MPGKWTVSKSTVQALNDALAALTDEISDLEMQWDEMSERWQESDKGTAVQDMIAELSNIADDIETAINGVEEFAP